MTHVLICGSPWGMGTYLAKGDDGRLEEHYGYPPRDMNPHLYRPDMDSCFQREIDAWEKAKREWDEQLDAKNSSLPDADNVAK